MGQKVADVVIQTSHQSQCHRLVLYHQDRSLHAFSDGLGHEALELGPRTNKAGPCLVLLRCVSVSLTEFIQWYTSSHIKRYCPRIFWLGAHSSDAPSKEQLLQQLCESSAPNGLVRLQCHPRKHEDWLGSRLPETFKLNPKEFEYVLSVVDIEGTFRWSLHEATSSYREAVLLTPSLQRPVSSAVHKLQEALAVVGHQLGAEDTAIDLGAAPGGWTYCLARQTASVIAVDPADLSPELLLPNVHHVRCKSELAGAQIQALLCGRKADLLVADMNQHPDTTVEAMKPLLPWLKSGGLIVMTMKFYGIGRDRSAVELRTQAAFGDFIVPSSSKFLWLMANTVNERTFIATRKG